MRTFSLRIPVSLAFALIATQAFAHAQLKKATPAVGGTVASASEIRLEFSEGVEPKFTKVSLTGPSVVCVGTNGTWRVPLASTDPSGCTAIESALEADQFRETRGPDTLAARPSGGAAAVMLELSLDLPLSPPASSAVTW